MNVLAAIDLEVLVWGILAVIWVIAQIVGQFNGTGKKDGKQRPNRENMPSELREFLEGIERQAKGQEPEPEPSPAPPPVQSPRPAPRPPTPTPTTQPVSHRPRQDSGRAVGRAAASSVKSVSQAKRKVNRQSARIAQALETRKKKFNREMAKQNKHLQEVIGNRFANDFSQQDITEHEGQIQQVGQVRSDDHGGINDIGIQGFKLPSLSLPATSDLVTRDISNPIRFSRPSDARRAFIQALVISPSVASQPPGSTELNKRE